MSFISGFNYLVRLNQFYSIRLFRGTQTVLNQREGEHFPFYCTIFLFSKLKHAHFEKGDSQINLRVCETCESRESCESCEF